MLLATAAAVGLTVSGTSPNTEQTLSNISGNQHKNNNKFKFQNRNETAYTLNVEDSSFGSPFSWKLISNFGIDAILV